MDAALRTEGSFEAQPRMGVRNLHNQERLGPARFRGRTRGQGAGRLAGRRARAVAARAWRPSRGPEDFIRSASGTFLYDRGRKAFWEAWFRRFDTEVSHPEFEYKMAYRRMLEVQARQLWRFVRGEAATYHGFTTR